MALSARLLQPGDEGVVEDFLKPHTPFAFFMRSNLRQGGIRYDGKPLQADYFGVFKSGHLAGALAHSWMGSVQVFSIDCLVIPALVKVWRDYLRHRPREVECILGPFQDVSALLKAAAIDGGMLHGGGEPSRLFSLDLRQLVIPQASENRETLVRRAQMQDLDLLTAWRHDFNVEVNGFVPGQKTYDKAKEEIARRIKDKDIFVLEEDGETVSFCASGGFLKDWTHVGPVWTPPEKRNRGYAKGVVAGALDRLRQEGLTHATLFVSRADAERVYRAVGFSKIGEWCFDVLKKPVLTL